MPGLEIHPLSGLRAEAATLLAARFARQREAEPLLPEVEDFEPHIPAEGHVATRGGRPVAYLGGTLDGDIARWGFAGHAASEPEALRDLFALQAAEHRVTRFMVTVPAAAPELIDAWFRLAFGCQAVWAVREVKPLDAAFDGTIRSAQPEDVDRLFVFDALLYDHQQASPSFSGFPTPPPDELRAEWDDVWQNDEFVPFVAERDGAIIALLGLFRRPQGDLRVPANNIDLAFAASREDVRGSGAGLALTAHAMTWAHEQGFRSMTVDWRSVNLLSSRFWPRRGFRPQYLRLYRAVP